MGDVRLNEPKNCPHCNVSLLGDKIPQEYIDEGFYPEGSHWKREIGVEYPEKYDGIWHLRCPDCKGTWGGREAILRSLKP